MSGANAGSEITQCLLAAWTWIASAGIWDNPWALANSAFTTSLAGAFAGAWGAQRIAERGKHRSELKQEIASTNAAIAVCFGIANSFLGLKKQHVKALKETFDKERAAIVEYKRKRDTGEIQGDQRYPFKADLMTLSIQSQPIDTLKMLAFERLSIGAKPLNLVMTLGQTIEGLTNTFQRRNALIEQYKVEFKDDNRDLVVLYFGFPYQGGNVNMDYPNTLEAMSQQTDDGIFFSCMLCDELHAHGLKLAAEFKVKFKKDVPRINAVSFEEAKRDGYVPDESGYPDWKKSFVKYEDQFSNAGRPTTATSREDSVIHKNN